MPDGLKEHCCRFVRSCMHADPNSRPTAKLLTEWLDDCRTVLQIWINDKATSKIKGSGESRPLLCGNRQVVSFESRASQQ